jgi:5-methylcytosine-specific restriction endonuclease McrA
MTEQEVGTPVIVSRKTAKAYGFLRYFTGKPCCAGHIEQRATRNGVCLACERLRDQESKARRQNKIKEYRKEYYARNREAVQEGNREYYRANLESQRERVKSYKAANRDKYVAYEQKRRASSRAGGSFSPLEIASIRSMQKDRCAVCRVNLNGAGTVDHIVPLSKGGPNIARNIQLLCKSCNSAKRDKDPVEFMRQKGRLI